MTDYAEVINIARCRIADLEDERERLLKALEERARECQSTTACTECRQSCVRAGA